MVASDFRTNAKIRQVLTRHWIDTQELHFGCFRGTVRLTGRMLHINREPLRHGGTGFIETIESEIRRIPGVRAVFFDLSNWRRDKSGAWEQTEGTDRTLLDEDPMVFTDGSDDAPPEPPPPPTG